MSYLDNDDDLFEYDPELETSSTTQSDSFATKTNSQFEDFVSKSKIDQDLDITDNNLLDEPKIKLALSFHHATHRHYAGVESPSYFKSITLVLDKITNGDFSLIHMFYRKEALIAQRIIFLSMMDAVIARTDNEQDNVLTEILTHLGLDLSDDHIDLFYGTSLSISRHCLAVDRIMYQHLGEKLSIPVNQALIDPNYDYKQNSRAIAEIITSDIYNKIFESITDTLAQEGLLEKIQETFGTSVRLTKNV